MELPISISRMRITSTEVDMHVAHSLWKEEVSVDNIALHCGVHRATVYRWIQNFRIFGLKHSVERFQSSKRSSKNKLARSTRDLIIRVRKQHKNCCGQKLQHYLLTDYNTKVSLSTIYRILGKQKLVRKQRRINDYSKINKRTEVEWERQLIEVDTVDLGELYAYTFIDVYTRQAQVVIRANLTSTAGKESLQFAMSRYKHTNTIQTDGGPEFKREFRTAARDYCKRLKQSRPYKKNDQAHIESFNRSLRQECVGHTRYKKTQLEEVQEKVEQYITYYNNKRAHLGLNLQTPNQVAICRI